MSKIIKILVVDDDAIIGQMLKAVLELKGYKVFVSNKPQETEQNIILDNIDLLILDKMISGVDGLSICKKVRKNEYTSKVKIIMMTALHDAKAVCMEAGADLFMTKPFDMDRLYQEVFNLLDS